MQIAPFRIHEENDLLYLCISCPEEKAAQAELHFSDWTLRFSADELYLNFPFPYPVQMDTTTLLANGEEEAPSITFASDKPVQIYNYDKSKEELILRVIKLLLEPAPQDSDVEEEELMIGNALQNIDLQKWAEAVRIEHSQTLAGPPSPLAKETAPICTFSKQLVSEM